MSEKSSKTVRIRLDIEIPLGVSEAVVCPADGIHKDAGILKINKPVLNAMSTNARCDYCGNCVICATGTYNGVRVYAQVFASSVSLPPSPPDGCCWMTPDAQGNWNFGNGNGLELPIVALMTTNTLAVWGYDDDGGSPLPSIRVEFTPHGTGATDCDGTNGSSSVPS